MIKKRLKKWLKNKLWEEITQEFILQLFVTRWRRNKPKLIFEAPDGQVYVIKISFSKND
jgi:hypothetical protein